MDAAVRLGIDIQLSQTFHEGNLMQMDRVINRVKDSGLRIIVAFCVDEDAFMVLNKAHAIGMAGNASDVQWIFPDSVASNFHPPPYLDPDALSGLLTFLPSTSSSSAYTTFLSRFFAQTNTGTMGS